MQTEMLTLCLLLCFNAAVRYVHHFHSSNTTARFHRAGEAMAGLMTIMEHLQTVWNHSQSQLMTLNVAPLHYHIFSDRRKSLVE